ncbi:diacylglycerol/lipid kinase family protein [Flexibacterium corallicola]|uniref:diacylglycerol/lipid kinase family protein n=1 Tax=Flexibacterium corallicola TaxID=3037259 RepID=UPI00286F300E|nr:diacylglycerol kinase family protein [Pseudovibrio sp. M1P-2-3]
MDTLALSKCASKSVSDYVVCRKVLIVANPTASHYSSNRIGKLKCELEKLSYSVELIQTKKVGEISAICADPQLDAEIIVVAGGDGSVNEAAQTIQELGVKPVITILPMGTANLLARELSLPENPLKLAHLIHAGHISHLYHCIANGRPFYSCASAGIDAEIIHTLPYSAKRRFGKVAYFFKALQIGLTRRQSLFKVRANNETHLCNMVIALNGNYYASLSVTKEQGSILEQGMFLVLVKQDRLLSLINLGIRLYFNRFFKSNDIEIIKTNEAYVVSHRSAAVQIDGEPFGGTPILLECKEKTLPVLVP